MELTPQIHLHEANDAAEEIATELWASVRTHPRGAPQWKVRCITEEMSYHSEYK